MIWLIALSIALSLAASLALVPLVGWVARSVGAIDKPDRQRKLQTTSVALGGGVAVFAAMVVAFVSIIYIDRAFFEQTLGVIHQPWYILFGSAAAMLVVGLVDDLWNMRGRQKLLLQILIVAGIVGSGTVIRHVNLLGFNVELGVFAFPLTMLWLLIAINALNLIDGADGMATTAGIIICFGLGIASLLGGGTFAPIVGFALTGSLMGFFVYNKPPAKIYLGDAGSMMIGLILGVLAIWTGAKDSAVLATAPIAIFALPLFDSTAAILRRRLTGRSIYQTDRAHLHHLLQEKYGNQRMLWIVAGLCSITTALSILSIVLEQPWLQVLGLLLVLGLLIFTRSFGHAEFRLLANRASRFAHSFTVAPADCTTKKHQRRVLLQGAGDWDTIWEPLVEFAKTHGMARVKIDISLPWLHEGYHASWQSVRLPEKASQLSICLPIFSRASSAKGNAEVNNSVQQEPEISDTFAPEQVLSEQVLIGRLEIIAPANDTGVYDRFSDLADHLAELGTQVDRIVSSLEQQTTKKKQPAGASADRESTAMSSQAAPRSQVVEVDPVSTNMTS